MARESEEEAANRVAEGNIDIRLSLYAEQFFKSIPLPSWIKIITPEGKLEMLSINEAFTSAYGALNRDFLGRRQSLYWSSIEAQRFEKHSRATIKTGKPVLSNTILLNRKTHRNERVSILKWPLFLDGRLAGVAGIILERTAISDKFVRTILLLVPIKILKWLLQTFLKKKGL